MYMNSFTGKQVLSLVRNGDYAHAGEVEAIEMVMASFPRASHRHILDVGCGRGGTAGYVQRHGWGQVVGLDREATSIARAQKVYPKVDFHACDVVDAGSAIRTKFDLIYMFNSFYAFPDQPRALATLAGLARNYCQLTIFDYLDRGGFDPYSLMSDGEPVIPQPLRLDRIDGMLKEVGWRLDEIQDLTGAYERWYETLLRRIERKGREIVQQAGIDGFASVYSQYARLLKAVRNGGLGGAIVRACRV